MGFFTRKRRASAARPALIWGMPSRCPACTKPGYLDRVDLVDRVMFQHCPWCLTKWETSEAEILCNLLNSTSNGLSAAVA